MKWRRIKVFLLGYALIFLYAMDSSAQIGTIDSLVSKKRQQIHDTYNYLLENNRFVEFLDLTTVIDFPVGIKKTIGNVEYVIAIDSIVMTPTYAYLNASMSFLPPKAVDRVAFRGTNIRFTQQGGLSGDARIELVGDYEINIPGDNISLVLKGEGTFVEWDCDGFKQFSISGSVNFSRDVLIPTDEEGTKIDGKVEAGFNLTLYDWNDFIASVTIPPFQPNGLEGFSFFVEDAVIDFSDVRNASSMKFPLEYSSPYVTFGNTNLWRGVYINSVMVRFPPQFAQEDGTVPLLRGDSFLIDESGLSCSIEGKYLLSIGDNESGTMSGWPFSIEEFKLRLVSNRLKHSSIKGEIVLPITNNNTTLDYEAFIDANNNYFFSISATDSLNFNLWKAGEATIYESSYVNVELRGGKFIPSAKLNGVMSINTKEISLADLAFENLELSSRPPFVGGGVFSPGSESALPKMADFDFNIEKIQLVNISDEEVSLDIAGGIAISGSQGGSFSASAGLSIISEQVSNSKMSKLKFKRLEIKKIELDVDNGACKFRGELEYFTEDNVYGNGYRGLVNAEFKPGIEVNAIARFGTINNFKYWYVDALAEFNTAIQVAPGFGIYGFGGGAYYHMKMQPTSQFQGSKSGIDYLPDEKSGLGVRAALSLGTIPSPKAFNGDASFEISFYKAGGIQNINFKGEGYFMTLPLENNLGLLQSNIKKISGFTSNNEIPQSAFKLPSSNPRADATEVFGHININYDFSNNILHGNLEVFVNAGAGMLKGTGPNNRAGWAVMHFAPEDWFVHIGTPSERLGLRMGVGKVYAKADGYFMVGTRLPASPAPNENVSRILGGLDLDYMRDENLLANGGGFAMGASLGFDTGDLAYWKFYARFMAGAGFDFMLKDYGPSAKCANRQGGIGLNGWYANGQAYAFFDGKIGLRVDVFGKVQQVDIINLSAAAVLQAKLPNPVWMRGIVGGQFDALGGLVKGDCRFEVTIGEECELTETSAVSGIKVIADITPKEGDQEVTVFNNPQIVFNMPIDKEFELVDATNKRKSFKILLDHFRVRSEQGLISGVLEWNNNRDVAILNSNEILPPESTLKIEVQISYAELVGGNWIPVTLDGNIIVEKRNESFKTGGAPDYIPWDNIDYSYPVIEMVNFYPQESGNGYLQLKKGQAYLFETSEGWKQSGEFITRNEDVNFLFSYSSTKRRVNFQIPTLKTNEIYTINLVRNPQANSSAIDRNVSSSEKSITTAPNKSDIKISEQKANGSIDELKPILLFSAPLRTSRYNKFRDKVEAMAVGNTLRDMVVPWDQHLLRSPLILNEHFGFIEREGNQYTSFEPLVKMEAVLEGNNYYQNKIFPLIYDNYPIDGVVRITERDVKLMGNPPNRAVGLRYTGTSSSAPFQNRIATISQGKTFLIYDLPRFYRRDFYDIRDQVATRYLNRPPPLPSQVNKLLFYSFPFVNEGAYDVRFNYYLPGESTPHSSYIVKTILDFSD